MRRALYVLFVIALSLLWREECFATMEETVFPPDIFSLTVSPDGRKVYFTSNIHTGDVIYEPAELFVVDLVTREINQLTEPLNFTAGRQLAISPDGSTIACVLHSYPKGDSIYFINPDGSNLIEFTTDNYGGSDPVWSPDGNFLAISIWRESETPVGGILIVDKSGNDIAWVVAGTNCYPIAWAPNGQYLLIVRGVENSRGEIIRTLWRVDLDLTKPFPATAFIPLTNPDEGDWSSVVSISPDSSKIIYPLANEVWVMNADGSGREVLFSLADDFLIEGVSWLPSGDKIVLIAQNGNTAANIYLINPDGTGLKQITNFTDYLAKGEKPTTIAGGIGTGKFPQKIFTTKSPLKGVVGHPKGVKISKSVVSHPRTMKRRNWDIHRDFPTGEEEPKSPSLPIFAGTLSLSALSYALWKLLRILA